jgi:hypothetical protein
MKVLGGQQKNLIDDTQASPKTAYSSSKVEQLIGQGGAGPGGAGIDDDLVGTVTTWSSSKIDSELDKKSDVHETLVETATQGPWIPGAPDVPPVDGIPAHEVEVGLVQIFNQWHSPGWSATFNDFEAEGTNDFRIYTHSGLWDYFQDILNQGETVNHCAIIEFEEECDRGYDTRYAWYIIGNPWEIIPGRFDSLDIDTYTWLQERYDKPMIAVIYQLDNFLDEHLSNFDFQQIETTDGAVAMNTHLGLGKPARILGTLWSSDSNFATYLATLSTNIHDGSESIKLAAMVPEVPGHPGIPGTPGHYGPDVITTEQQRVDVKWLYEKIKDGSSLDEVIKLIGDHNTSTDSHPSKQDRIPAGTNGHLVTYSGTEGVFGHPFNIDAMIRREILTGSGSILDWATIPSSRETTGWTCILNVGSSVTGMPNGFNHASVSNPVLVMSQFGQFGLVALAFNNANQRMWLGRISNSPTSQAGVLWREITSVELPQVLEALIKDNDVSIDSTWSSQKIASEIQNINAGGGSASINDAVTNITSTWSSSKINTQLENKANLFKHQVTSTIPGNPAVPGERFEWTLGDLAQSFNTPAQSGLLQAFQRISKHHIDIHDQSGMDWNWFVNQEEQNRHGNSLILEFTGNARTGLLIIGNAWAYFQNYFQSAIEAYEQWHGSVSGLEELWSQPKIAFITDVDDAKHDWMAWENNTVWGSINENACMDWVDSNGMKITNIIFNDSGCQHFHNILNGSTFVGIEPDVPGTPDIVNTITTDIDPEWLFNNRGGFNPRSWPDNGTEVDLLDGTHGRRVRARISCPANSPNALRIMQFNAVTFDLVSCGGFVSGGANARVYVMPVNTTIDNNNNCSLLFDHINLGMGSNRTINVLLNSISGLPRNGDEHSTYDIWIRYRRSLHQLPPGAL